MRGLENDFSIKCAVLDKVSFFSEMVSSTVKIIDYVFSSQNVLSRHIIMLKYSIGGLESQDDFLLCSMIFSTLFQV